jgi:Flp pilus assembly protein TadG
MRAAVTRRLKRLSRDERGVSAVEFALIAPVLILFYFGLAEATQVMMAERKVVHTASAVGDIVAQLTTTTPTELDDFFSMAGTLMTPFPASTQLKICVASISADATSGAMTVDWNRVKNSATCPAKGSAVASTAVPANLIDKGQSAIMARATYTYTGPTNMVIKTNPTFTKTFYLRPRISNKVVCSAC